MIKFLTPIVAVSLIFGAFYLYVRATHSREEVSNLEAESAPALQNRRNTERVDLHDKLSRLSAGGPLAEEKTRLLVAATLDDLFADNNVDGLAELDQLFGELHLGSSFILIGVDFVGRVPEGKRREALIFLEGLRSSYGRDIVIGGLAEAIVRSPDVGLDVYSDIVMDWDMAREVRGEIPFSDRVWTNVGRFLVDARGDAAMKDVIPRDLAARELQNLLSGLSDGLRSAVNTGEASRIEEIFGTMEQGHRAQLSVKIANGYFDINKSNVAAFQKLLPVLTSIGAVDSAGYARMGRGLNEESFDLLFFGSASIQITEEIASVVKGWSAKRPKSSVEKFFQAGAKEILRPGFQAWMEVDSIEASGWLVSKPVGAERDICTEELCGYLMTKGAEAEAKAWLAQLPMESQERLKEKYGFQ